MEEPRLSKQMAALVEALAVLWIQELAALVERFLWVLVAPVERVVQEDPGGLVAAAAAPGGMPVAAVGAVVVDTVQGRGRLPAAWALAALEVGAEAEGL